MFPICICQNYAKNIHLFQFKTKQFVFKMVRDINNDVARIALHNKPDA